jgi:glutathione synthase/RimK-type ligase-like ATP-grasp enzyme
MAQSPLDFLCLPCVKTMKQVLAQFSYPINLTKGNFEKLEFLFQKNSVKVLFSGRNLKEFDFVWLSSFWDSRDLAYAVKLYLDKTKVFATHVEKSTSKLTDQMICSLGGISVPDSLFLGEKDVVSSLEQIEKICGYPLIIKDTKGSRGLDSLYIKTESELVQKLKQFPEHRKFLFQKYIPNLYDWGILVANGQVVSGERSYPEIGEFRNNACNGAKEIFVKPEEIPSEIQKIAIKANDLLGLSWSRADIIVDSKTQQPYLLEVNRLPGITLNTTEMSGAYQFLSEQIEKLDTRC